MANSNWIDSPRTVRNRAESAKRHFDYSRKRIDKIKAQIILDHEKLEEEAWLEDRRRNREKDRSTTLSTAKPIIRAV